MSAKDAMRAAVKTRTARLLSDSINVSRCRVEEKPIGNQTIDTNLCRMAVRAFMVKSPMFRLHTDRCVVLLLAIGLLVIVYDRSQLPDDITQDPQSQKGNLSSWSLHPELITPPSCDCGVKCETLVQQPISEPGSYIIYRLTDAIGGDLFPVRTHNVDVLKRLCDALPECVGFNTNGWLKSAIQRQYRARSDLYLKSRTPPGEEAYLSSTIIEKRYGLEYLQMTRHLKVYMYKVTADRHVPTRRYQKDWGGKYDAEALFIHLLSKSRYRTKDPDEATFFFIPTRCTSYRLMVADREQAQVYTQHLVREVVNEIIQGFPYWNRSLGSDHFYVCAHDMGSLSSATADPNLLKNSVAIVNTADAKNKYYYPNKDISLPPHASHGPTGLPSTGRGGTWVDPDLRHILAFFAGDLTVGLVRPALEASWWTDPELVILGRHLPRESYIKHLQTSKFCLCPRGNEVWSPRLVEAVWFGCIPVIMADHYVLPLQGLLDWDTFSLRLREDQVPELKTVLKAVTQEDQERMRTILRQIYAHLTWFDPPRPYDAFNSVLFQLWQRRQATVRLSGAK